MDLTDYDAMLKEYYTPEMVRELAYSDNVLLGLLPKKREGGKTYIQPINNGKPGGASATFSTAQINQYNSKYNAFGITRVKQYQLATVETETLLASEGNAGAFAPAFEEFDKAHRSLADKTNRRLYRSTTGTIGQFLDGAAINGATITLADKADAWNFEEDDVIAFSATDGSALLDSGATVTVVSVDHETGIVTTSSADIGTEIASLTDTSFIYQAGDRLACAAGLESWLPVTDRATKLAAAFYGVTRSTAPERLGGIYMDGADFGDLNEIVIKAVSKAGQRGGKTDLVLMNTERFSDLQILWLNKHVIHENIEVNVREKVGDRMMTFSTLYQGMKANVGGRTVQVLSDRACPTNRLYALQKDTWKIWHTGDLMTFPLEKFAKGILMPAATADQFEGRVATYHNLGCSAPGFNVVVELPSA